MCERKQEKQQFPTTDSDLNEEDRKKIMDSGDLMSIVTLNGWMDEL